MKMSYCQSQGHTCYFTGQTENPFKIIRIVKHLNFLDNRFFRQHLFQKNLTSKNNEFHKSEKHHHRFELLVPLFHAGFGPIFLSTWSCRFFPLRARESEVLSLKQEQVPVFPRTFLRISLWHCALQNSSLSNGVCRNEAPFHLDREMKLINSSHK
jgi:hypothetical protein